MKAYVVFGGVVAGLIVLSFLLVEAWGIPLLSDPSGWIYGGGLLAALVGVGLLVADIFIPVPSSIIMLGHGAAFGVLGGFVLSLLGSIIGWMIGWWLGKKSRSWIERMVSSGDRLRAEIFLRRYGMLAIILSRMVPVLAETVAILAGSMGLGWNRVLIAFTLGAIPPALIYALAGALAVDFSAGLWIAGGVFLIAGVSWWMSQRLLSPSTEDVAASSQGLSEKS